VHAPARPLRILLVEDHGDTARIMRRLLSAQGHQVQSAADVATALHLAAAHTFDLLLSDLGLPDGSGCDLMRTLRQRRLMLPGIALSGYGQEQDLEQSRKAGFAAHLVKPINIQRLEEAIAHTVGNGRRAGAAHSG
jgi:two-component system CheB/CheR fusion protein